MGLSDQDARIEPLWTNGIRYIRRVAQSAERELQHEETELRDALATLRGSPCAREKIQRIEQTLRQREAGAENKLRQIEIAYSQTNIKVKLGGLDALLSENDAAWQKTANYLAGLVTALQIRNLGQQTDSTNPAALPAPPEFDNSRIETISRVAGRDSDIDILLRSLGNALKDYTQRKRRRRVVLVGARVLLFLGLVFLADGLLNLVQPFEFYLLAAAGAWFLDEYFIRPALDRRFDKWNARALEQTIGDFYRAQRRALYLTAALETHMREANAALKNAET